jgi:hypothetical protein
MTEGNRAYDGRTTQIIPFTGPSATGICYMRFGIYSQLTVKEQGGNMNWKRKQPRVTDLYGKATCRHQPQGIEHNPP